MEKNKINYNYSNDKLEENDWINIEIKCKEQKHIDENDNLKNIIDFDEKTLQSYNITFEQLEKFFEKVQCHFFKQIKNKKFYEMNKNEKILIDNIVINKEWRQKSFLCVKIFNDKLIVVLIGWDNAEKCPFQSKHNKCNEHSDTDWFFIKIDTQEHMHIDDLLFHQIGCHHFFQSIKSSYHVDPHKLIKFFNLQPDIDYTTEYDIEKVWCCSYIVSSTRDLDKLPKKKYLVKQEQLLEYFDTDKIKHTKYGLNDIYYNNDRVIFIVNDMNTFPSPTIFNNHIIPFNQKPDFIGAMTFHFDETKNITKNEETKKWI